MKFKTLNESSIADYLAKRFKEYEIYTDDGDRYWHFVDKNTKRFHVIVGPVEGDADKVKDFSNLITLKGIRIDYSKKTSKKTCDELNSWIDDFATRLKRAFKF